MNQSLTTQNIKISVEKFYQPDFSNPFVNEYVFAYRITIENNSQQAVKLLKRNWHIFDSCGTFKDVEGIGVVGKQPILQPGESYQYVSGCTLSSDMGHQSGFYLFQEVESGIMFNVDIPKFQLITPSKSN